MTSSTKPPGFTLVELLMVVTLVGILTALGLAASKGVSEKGKSTRCLHGLRQVGAAIQLYVGESGGRLPDTAHQPGRSWTNTLAAFLGTNFLGRCPSVRHHRSPRLTYAWNDVLADLHGVGIVVASLRRPSSTVVVAELATNRTGEHFHFSGVRGGASRVTPNQFRSQVNTTCHGTGANYLFADGHVEWISWSETQRRLTQPDSAFLVP